MQFVKGVYSELPSHLNQIFEPRPPLRVKDISELNLEQILNTTYTVTTVHCERSVLSSSTSNTYHTVSQHLNAYILIYGYI